MHSTGPLTPVSQRAPAAPGTALADVAVVLTLAGAAFMLELGAATHLPWGTEARGVLAVLVAAIASLALTRLRGGRLSDLGFTRPARWWTVPFQAAAIFIAFVVVQNVAPLLVAPIFELPPPDFSRYDAIRGNLPAALAMAVMLPLFAAIPEEIVYRGFLINRFSAIFGTGGGGIASSVMLQALIFGAIHFQWGPGGVIVTTLMGLVWGIAYVLCGRNLWIVIIAHSLAHLALVAQLYYSAPAA